MEKAIPEELDFLEKLNTEDRERFFNMTEEEKRLTISENKLEKKKKKVREENAEMNQLTDRIASKSFQG